MSAPSLRALARALLLALSLPACGAPTASKPAPVAAPREERTIRVTARKFEFEPAELHLKLGEPVILELVSLDRMHGFDLPDLHVRTDIYPDRTNRVRVVPDKVGRFTFHCDVFCGEGHEHMSGEVVVDP